MIPWRAVSGFAFVPKCAPGLKRIALQPFVDLSGALHKPDGLFHSQTSPGSIFPSFACLSHFNPHYNVPEWTQASKIPNLKRGSQSLLSTLGNSFIYLCPLKSQYGVRIPLPAHSCPPPLSFMAQITPDILDIEMHDVCFPHKLT